MKPQNNQAANPGRKVHRRKASTTAIRLNTIVITTPENIEITHQLAGLGSRMAAAMVDLTILVVAYALILMAWINFVLDDRLYSIATSGWVQGGLIVFTFFVFFGYFIISEMVMKGQSLGKKMLKLRVIAQNGGPVTFYASLIRNLFRYFLDLFGVGVLCIFFNPYHKRTGDMAALTIVVAENPVRSDSLQKPAQAISMGQEPLEKVLAGSPYALSTEEMAVLKDYFSRKNTFLDNGAYAGQRLKAYFAQRLNIPAANINDAGLEKIMQMNL